MPTVKTQMTEMKGARCDRISLVSKAASRIPFRVIKEDRSMTNPLKELDLARTFKGKKAAPVPTVVGVVTMKGDTLEAVKKAAKEAGFKVEEVIENADGSVVLKQGDVADGEAITVIKLGDTVAVTLKGFSPYNMQMEMPGSDGTPSSFADLCAAQGFYPDVSTAMDVLQSAVMSAAYKADTPDAAAELVGKMFDEAKAYASSLMKALPASAFKMEQALKSGAPNANGSMATANAAPAGVTGTTVTSALGGTEVKDPLAGGAPNGQSAASGLGDGANSAKKAEMPKGMDAAKWAKMSDAEKAAAIEDAKDGGADDASENPDGTKKAKKADVDAGAALSKMLSDGLQALSTNLTAQLTQAVGQVQKSVDGVKTSVEGLSTEVKRVEGVAKAAQQAVTGTVLGSVAGDDAHQTTQKSEQQGYRGREIDTGYAPRRRPAAAR